MRMPEDYTEFRLQWAAKGQEVATLGNIIALIEGKAAEAFTRRRDDVANAFRDLAQEIVRKKNTASSELTEFINAEQTRRLEFVRKMKAEPPKFQMKEGE